MSCCQESEVNAGQAIGACYFSQHGSLGAGGSSDGQGPPRPRAIS